MSIKSCKNITRSPVPEKLNSQYATSSNKSSMCFPRLSIVVASNGFEKQPSTSIAQTLLACIETPTPQIRLRVSIGESNNS